MADHSVITVISDQVAMAVPMIRTLGTITVYGDLVDAGDISVNANPAFGVTRTLDDWLEIPADLLPRGTERQFCCRSNA